MQSRETDKLLALEASDVPGLSALLQSDFRPELVQDSVAATAEGQPQVVVAELGVVQHLAVAEGVHSQLLAVGLVVGL